MGLRFRKSINLGGFRINFSKSGIGYSFGVPGIRHTKKSSGGIRTTTSIPGTGISHVHESKKHHDLLKKQCIDNKLKNNNLVIQSEVTDSSQNEFINKFNEATKRTKLLKSFRIIFILAIFIGLAYLSENLLFLILVFSGLLALLFIPSVVSFDIDLDFEDKDYETLYKNLLVEIKSMNSITKLWEIKSVNPHNDWKNHAGANVSIDHAIVHIDKKLKIINSSLDICPISAQNKKIVFLPNIIAVYQNKHWIGIEWKQFKISYTNSTFMETGNVSNDTTVIGYTYKHPNKNGGPDKRYTDNPRIAQCAYAGIELKSSNGLEVILLASNRERAYNFYDAVNKICSLNIKQFNE